MENERDERYLGMSKISIWLEGKTFLPTMARGSIVLLIGLLFFGLLNLLVTYAPSLLLAFSALFGIFVLGMIFS